MLERQRLAALVAALVAVFAGVAVALVAAFSDGSHRPVPEARYRYSAHGLIPVSGTTVTHDVAALRGRALAEALDRLPRGTSAVAWELSRPVQVYGSPRARRPELHLAARDQFGIVQVLLVRHAISGWLQVYLPIRPNDSTGWIRTGGVRLELDPYRVVVDTGTHRITALRADRVIMQARAGIGKAATPTPHGRFYMMEKLRMVPATGPYGTYALGLSAYSNVLTTFGTGQAQIALHGTDEPWTVGQDTSNGCVHLENRVADWLARTLPLGTPVEIA